MKHLSIIFGILTGVLFLAPQAARAADLFYEPLETSPGAGLAVRVMVRFDEPINALEGTLVFDPSVLAVSRINSSPAGVPLWIRPPAVVQPGGLYFAGIFPGGIAPRISDRLPLMEVFFEVLSEQRTTLSFRDVTVFRHGPDAQEDEVRSIPITAIVEVEDIGVPEIIEDKLQPRPFDIAIFTGDLIERRKAIAIFYARDLQSGVEKYEIRIRPFGISGTWNETHSPSVLPAYWPWSIIDVRATDHAGNSTESRYIPNVLKLTYILLGIVVILWIWRVRWARRKRF